jgi:hypothetical protein
MAAPRNRVLLVGWDAADWKVIHPLLDAGKLPALSRMVASGAMGECVSVTPSIAALTWTTVVTGVRSDRHGILSDREPDPVSGDWRRTSCRGRTAKALWNIATQGGLRSIVINQAASHPAEPILGVSVDERITSVTAPLGAEWPLPEGCIQPAEKGASLAELRLHPRELPVEELLPFIPGVASIDTSKDPRPGWVADGLAATVTVHAIATELLEQEAWDFAAIRYHLLEPLAQAFMRYRPPLLEGIPETDAALYGGVVDAGYTLLDAMLGALVDIAGPDPRFRPWLSISGRAAEAGRCGAKSACLAQPAWRGCHRRPGSSPRSAHPWGKPSRHRPHDPRAPWAADRRRHAGPDPCRSL